METTQIKNQRNLGTQDESVIRRFLSVFINTLVWSFIVSMILGGLAAAVWTIIPTGMLDWGSNELNLIGYVSHCSYTPISTGILLVVTIIGISLANIKKHSWNIGVGVFVGAVAGLGIGLIGGIDIGMFIGMGIGVGFGVFLGLIRGMMENK